MNRYFLNLTTLQFRSDIFLRANVRGLCVTYLKAVTDRNPEFLN